MTPFMSFHNLKKKKGKKQPEFPNTCHEIFRKKERSVFNVLNKSNKCSESTKRGKKKMKCIKVPVTFWMLNHTQRGGGGKTNEEIQERGTAPLSMVSFIEPLSSSMIQFPHSLEQRRIGHRATEGLQRMGERTKFHILTASSYGHFGAEP